MLEVWKKTGIDKNVYIAAKRRARHVIYLAKELADRELQNTKESKDKIYRIAKQMRGQYQDVTSDKCV